MGRSRFDYLAQRTRYQRDVLKMKVHSWTHEE